LTDGKMRVEKTQVNSTEDGQAENTQANLA
jgi:hypothetical protein